MQKFETLRQPLLGELAMSRKKERREREEKKMPFIVATYVYASSQGQRTHSARTNTSKVLPAWKWKMWHRLGKCGITKDIKGPLRLFPKHQSIKTYLLKTNSFLKAEFEASYIFFNLLKYCYRKSLKF